MGKKKIENPAVTAIEPEKPAMDAYTEGVAKFKSMPSEIFRFRVERELGSEGKLWLENKASKKQWECEVKKIADFAPEGIAIPLETVLGYVESCLKASTAAEPSASFEADLLKHPNKPGEMVLEVMFVFDISGFLWKPTYKFPMRVVQVEEIDVLRSQLQDQREELEQLKNRLDQMQSKNCEMQQLTARITTLENNRGRHGY